MPLEYTTAAEQPSAPAILLKIDQSLKQVSGPLLLTGADPAQATTNRSGIVTGADILEIHNY